MRAGALALLHQRHRDLAERLHQRLVLGQQLGKPDRAGQATRAAADDDHADLDALVLRVGRALHELLVGVDGGRELGGGRCHQRSLRGTRATPTQPPLFAFTASVSFGRILLRSPTTPRSENSKIGAFGSLLIATMFSEFCIPTLCWIAPEMPAARYSFGATVLPVCPICAAYGYQPASTTARVAATAPPSAPASSSSASKPSLLPSPRPPATSASASSMLTSAPRCSPRRIIRARVEKSDSSTARSSTGAGPEPSSAA